MLDSCTFDEVSALRSATPGMFWHQAVAPTQAGKAAAAERTRTPAGARGRFAHKHARTREELVVLLLATGQADQAAFGELYEATSSALYSVALRIVHRESVAEEVLHDAFVSVWQNAARFDPAMAAPFTWLVSIVRNRALDVLRHGRFECATPSAGDDDDEFFNALPSEAPGPAAQYATGRREAEVHRTLRNLPPRQREALMLAYFEDKSHAEVAAAMSIPLGTAKSWIRRALADLRTAIETGARL